MYVNVQLLTSLVYFPMTLVMKACIYYYNFLMSILTHRSTLLMLVYKNTASTVHKYSLPNIIICRECVCTVHGARMHGIRLYHAWNTPVPHMEYACITHGICLYNVWNMPEPCMEYTLSCMEHASFMHEN